MNKQQAPKPKEIICKCIFTPYAPRKKTYECERCKKLRELGVVMK